MVKVQDTYVQVNFGNCILFDKHKIQSYRPLPNHKFTHDFIHFDIDTESEKNLILNIPKGEVINLSFPELISDALYNIMCEQEMETTAHKSQILDLLGSIFLYRIKNELTNKTPNNKKRKNNHQLLRELRKNIYRNPAQKLSIEEASKNVYLSRYYFQHLYKQIFSVSYQKDIINARITASKRLLLNSDLSVNEIALLCGYQNSDHFVKQFKSEVGITPGNFRRR